MTTDTAKADLPSDAALHGIVEALENHYAVIRTADNQTLLVAREHLPDDIAVNDDVTITIGTKRSQEHQQEKMAKALLSEILNPEP